VGIAALIVLSSGACTPFDDLMASVFGRSMRSQASFDPYENPRPPAENTVPFAAGNFPARAGELNLGQPEALVESPPPFTQLEVVRQAEVVTSLASPMQPTTESLIRGRELYLRYCAPCHGPDGAGETGYIVAAGYPLIYPLTAENVIAYPDGYLYGMIRVGRGLMPAYGHRVSHFDRWNIVNYVRQLQGVLPAEQSGGNPEAETPTPDGGSRPDAPGR
jgi:mono/diheme cytochrome c family protein